MENEGKRRFLSRARFYPADEVTSLLARTGFVPLKVDARAGFSVIAAEKG